MPCDYSKYPPNWKEIRKRILERSKNCCEWCEVKNYSTRKGTKIILTIAHLDHDETNWDVKDDRLAALCQSCHLQYDAPEKKRRAFLKKYKQTLFPI